MAFLPAMGMAIAGFLGTSGVVATTAAVASLAGAGMIGASLLSGGPKIPSQAQGTNIATPNPSASLVDAQAQADARRRESLLSGGLINPTGGRGSLLSSDQTTKKTLLGQ